MTTTPNLGLTKDAPTDLYSVERVNANSDRIDEFAGDVNDALAGKQAALTFDQTPTEDSANPVTSGGVYDAMHVQSDEIDSLANVGAKNALRLDSYRNQTADSNVTFTWNETAGTIAAVNSSATPKVTTYQLNVTVTRAGLYTFTCGVGSAVVGDDPDSLYDCFLYSGGTVIRDNDPTTTDVGSTAYIEAGTYRLDIRIHNGVTVNTVFKPMLRPAALTDTEYVPYAPSNRELYELIEALTARVEALENA